MYINSTSPTLHISQSVKVECDGLVKFWSDYSICKQKKGGDGFGSKSLGDASVYFEPAISEAMRLEAACRRMGVGLYRKRAVIAHRPSKYKSDSRPVGRVSLELVPWRG
jgi:hypothetical protein